MATNLYEVLELPHDASPEQIRKAYKKKALKTHPDRLPPGATSEDKTKSEEEFRLVNNAYEVLNDPQKRRVYDLHGIWPPPEPEAPPLPRRNTQSHHRSHSQHGYRNPRSFHFQEPLFGDHYDPFVFTDPFTLFESIFGDLDDHHPSPFHHRHHRSGMTRHDDFDRVPHHMPPGFAGVFGHPMFSGQGSGFRPIPSMAVNFPSMDSSRFSDGNRGRWAGESYMTTTVNGVTQSVRKRRDWDGNEHVTRTFPDGREVYTINSVEQPARGYISSRSARDTHHSPSPATVSQPHITSPRGSVPSASAYMPPPPYPGQSGSYAPPSREPDYRHHNRRFSETRPVNADSFAPGPDVDHHRKDGHRKRWWG